MKLINSIAALIFGLTLTSCLGDPENTITQDFGPYTFVYVTDNQTNQTCTDDAATFTIKTETNSARVDITMNNIKLPDGNYINLALLNQKATLTEKGATRISAPLCSSVVDGITHTISDFQMDLYLRYYNSQNYTLLVCNYTVDNRYSMRVVFNPSYFWGPTQVIDQDGKIFNNTAESSFYGIAFDIEKKKGTLGLISAKFAENMPAMNMSFPNLDYTFTQYGFTLKSDKLTPMINNVPFPSYEITDLSISGNYGGPVSIQFTCTIDTEKVKGTYKVSSSLDVFPPKTETGTNP